ncbi:MAG: M48 family metalloprotease, partial [Acinetobacter sp.]|nr:M48 family metalloprotease [Acinetobacter sp.]
MSSVLLQNTQAIALSHDYTTSSLHAYQVPNIGGGVGLIDQYRERMIGENVYRQVQRQMPVIHDIWLEEQLMSVFSHIVGQSQSQQPIALLLIDDAQINAFAVPGGLFAMNTGLILSAKNMGEVAGVMAHEVAHVSQRHYSRSKETFKGQSLLALAGILVGAAVAAKADGEAGTAVMMGTQAALMNKQLSYSRDQEREADRIGMQYLYAAGYDPHHMANFFETMHRQSPQVGFLPEFWLTHPLTSDRMSEARLRANQYPKLSPHLAQSQQHYQQQQHFDLIQLYSGVISKKTSEAQLLALMKQKNSQATLALAAYYVRKNEWQKAEQILKNFQPSVEQQV